jgi:hypothetical protein
MSIATLATPEANRGWRGDGDAMTSQLRQELRNMQNHQTADRNTRTRAIMDLSNNVKKAIRTSGPKLK